MINQAINLQHPFSQDLVLSKTIKGIQWTYKMLYLHQECWDQKISFERALKALMRAFPERALMGFNNIYIHLSSRKFHWVYMSKIPSPTFPNRELSYRFFNSLHNKFWNSAKLWLILSQSELSRTELPKCTPSISMENFHVFNQFFFLYDPACKAWLFEKFILDVEASYSFKITCILVRQVISL